MVKIWEESCIQRRFVDSLLLFITVIYFVTNKHSNGKNLFDTATAFDCSELELQLIIVLLSGGNRRRLPTSSLAYPLEYLVHILVSNQKEA